MVWTWTEILFLELFRTRSNNKLNSEKLRKSIINEYTGLVNSVLSSIEGELFGISDSLEH